MNAPYDSESWSEAGGGGAWFLNHLPRILWDRKLIIILTFLIALIGSVVAAYMIPTLYRSSSTLLVQSQDLPTNVVDSPQSGSIDHRIAKIRERVLSRGDLIALIEQNNLYPDDRGDVPLSKLIERMRNATSIQALEGSIGSPSATQSDTIAVTLSFDYPEAPLAQSVLQSFVTSFLRIDSEQAEDQANLSVRFLEDQSRELGGQIADIEREITELKTREGSTLASSGSVGMIDSGSYTAQIANLESQNRQLLQAQRETGGDGQVAAAERALAAAQARYSDSHPDVVAAREQLRQARILATQRGTSSYVTEQIAANNRSIEQLRAARESQIARANAAMAGSARAPVVMEQAMQLEGRANNLRNQYREISINLMKARNAARMVNEQKAERLALVDAPNLPDSPFWPNRPLLIAAGALGGLGLGFVLALALEFLFRPLRSPAQVESAGMPVIGVVPILTNEKPRDPFWRKLPFLKKRKLAHG